MLFLSHYWSKWGGNVCHTAVKHFFFFETFIDSEGISAWETLLLLQHNFNKYDVSSRL